MPPEPPQEPLRAPFSPVQATAQARQLLDDLATVLASDDEPSEAFEAELIVAGGQLLITVVEALNSIAASLERLSQPLTEVMVEGDAQFIAHQDLFGPPPTPDGNASVDEPSEEPASELPPSTYQAPGDPGATPSRPTAGFGQPPTAV